LPIEAKKRNQIDWHSTSQLSEHDLYIVPVDTKLRSKGRESEKRRTDYATDMLNGEDTDARLLRIKCAAEIEFRVSPGR
jgi:hypothetical protein